MARRQFAPYSFMPTVTGGRIKVCGLCGAHNQRDSAQCAGCRRWFRRPKRQQKPARGTEARLAHDLAHASKMADASARKLALAVTVMRKWYRKERQLAARLAAGPQPPRPRRVVMRRGIKLGATSI